MFAWSNDQKWNCSKLRYEKLKKNNDEIDSGNTYNFQFFLTLNLNRTQTLIILYLNKFLLFFYLIFKQVIFFSVFFLKLSGFEANFVPKFILII